MTAPATPLDIVTVSIALATWVVGAEVAQIVGPYSVIIAGAIGGATWSASSRPRESRWAAASSGVMPPNSFAGVQLGLSFNAGASESFRINYLRAGPL